MTHVTPVGLHRDAGSCTMIPMRHPDTAEHEFDQLHDVGFKLNGRWTTDEMLLDELATYEIDDDDESDKG